MKRASRPFVVEVRRGQKKTPFIEPEPMPDASRDDALRRAEAALFEGRVAATTATRAERPEPRRILKNLAEVDPVEAMLAEQPEVRRRGRKPGSKNKPKEQAVLEAAETTARRVALTPEVVSAALESMARVSQPAGPRSAEAAAPVSERRIAPEAAGSTEAGLQQPAGAAPNAAHATAPARRALRARSKILDVYVFKTAPKPWELWKQRARGALRKPS